MEEVTIKTMLSAVAPNVRGLVNFVNNNEIQKEDIVSLVSTEGQFILLYYA